MKRLPFELRLPLVAAPMFLVSGPELVIAACRAGILGSFPTSNCRTPDELDRWMTEIVAAIQGAPWAANLITHSSNRELPAHLDLVARHRPPVVITALGSPRPVIETVKAYGGLVFADVVSLNLARKAAEAGVDGLVCVSSGAGGHTGSLSPFAFLSAVRQFFDGFVAVGGGVADGEGIAGAVMAGADLVYMGTRFIAAEESRAVEPYKKMLIDCTADDLVVSAAVTGTPASWLMPSLQACGFDVGTLAQSKPARDYGSGSSSHTRWRDMWAAGQGLHAVRRIEPVSRIVEQLASGFDAARARFGTLSY